MVKLAGRHAILGLGFTCMAERLGGSGGCGGMMEEDPMFRAR